MAFQNAANAPGECILWDGKVDVAGYGLDHHEGSLMAAHRAAVLRSGRGIPKGWIVDHLCGVKLCINPDHLAVVSPLRHARSHTPQGQITLRHERLARGLGLRDLEQRSGISRGILSEIERGRVLATPEELAAIGDALGVQLRLVTIPVIEAVM